MSRRVHLHRGRLSNWSRPAASMTLVSGTWPVISADDHLIEPPDLFEGRMPAALADRAPRIVEDDDGTEAWLYEGNRYPNIGLNAVVGRPREEWSMEPARFDEMRPGCLDIDARLADMDEGGIWASVCFPSLIAGFAGTVFARSQDPELGLACVRAWNDWHLDVWAGTKPERIIPLQLPWLVDPVVAADEVRRNAEQGLQGGELRRAPGERRAAVVAHRALGPVPRRVQRDRHRRVPARRVRRVDRGDIAGCPARALHDAVPGQRARRGRRLAVGAHPAAVPRAPHRARRGWHRLGAHAARPPRLGDGALGHRRRRRVAGRRDPRRGAAAATSGSARSTTRRRWAPAIASGSTTSSSSATTPTPTRRGRTPRRCSPIASPLRA